MIRVVQKRCTALFLISGRKRRIAEMEKEHEIRVLMVEPNEHPKEFFLENTLQAMQKAVGGLIEIVNIDYGIRLLLNAEGKLKIGRASCRERVCQYV